MKIFAPLYDRAMLWAKHRHAQWYLALLSFAEASFFPVPTDVMLAPMALADTRRAWYFALLATITSVLGGVAGYFIGVYSFEAVAPLLEKVGYMPYFETASAWFQEWGVWVVFVAGFSPIPYKVFTIAAGVAAMSFLPFVLVSLIARGARYFLVAALMVIGGEKLDKVFRNYIDRIGWGVVVICVVVVAIMQGSY